ncbi:MAG: HlyD family efflux transporter periplasmic adaptor subunit [Alphaproteobacteria bacterium]|nr:HlyD family efflux transporter periplasmic adaptor subunit [Alphaproteobacteria bacterium]MBE8220352.1 HlyD family efflux transporter periplasmic adaptor subunit [Alphaproteobacteria bacterium]
MEQFIERLKTIFGQVKQRSQEARALASAYIKQGLAWLITTYINSPVKTRIDNFRTTYIGKWLEGHILRIAASIYNGWRQVRSVYKKLTSPPPDPLMAALMMAGQKIDIDEDPTQLKGRRVFIIIAAFFSILVFWAATTELDSVVRAEGQVVPPGSVQLVQNRLSGSLVTIRVALGDRVEKGDVLFRLEDEEVNANFDDNEIMRLSALAKVVRLTAEKDGAEDIAFPAWMRRQFPDAVASEQSVFERRLNALQKRLIVIDQQVRESEIIVQNIKEQIKVYGPLVEGGHEPRLTMIDLNGRLAQASLAVERGRSEYEATASNFRADSARELADVQTQADQANAREDAFRMKVNNAEVRAPADGVISAVHVKTEGAVVQAGTVLAEIVPDQKNVIVEAKLSAQDIASVFPGQIAQISLSAYDVSRYGNLEGRVLKIASNTMQDDPSLPPYYLTVIEVPTIKFSKSDEAVEITTGMAAVIDIIGAKRTILSYIFTPLDRATSIAFREQ